MCKKILAVVIMVSMLAMTACGGEKASSQKESVVTNANETNAKETEESNGIKQTEKESNEVKQIEYATEVTYDNSSLENIIISIQSDFRATSQRAKNEWESTREVLGETYKTYIENEESLQAWYEFVNEESEALFERTTVGIVDYFLVLGNTLSDKPEAVNDAMETFYNTVYGEVFDEFYIAVYQELYDTVYEIYHEGIIDDAMNTVDVENWVEAKGDFYDEWEWERSSLLDDLQDMRSELYGAWLETYGEFLRGNFDVAELFGEVSVSSAKKSVDESEKKVYENKEVSSELNSNEAPETGGNSEVQASIEAQMLENTEYESGDFTYCVYSDGTAVITGYTSENSLVNISSEIDGYKVSRIGASAFENLGFIETVTLWADIIEFGDNAFKNCKALTDISIPSSTVRIGKSAFEGCSNMENVIFWNGEIIDDRAFKDCVSLKDISIPMETKEIGESAFEGCINLESVLIWGDEVNIGINAFANCSKLQEVSEGVYAMENDIKDGTDSVEDINGELQKVESSGIRPEFKEAMDSYEAFFDEYVAFMQKYKEASATEMVGMMTDYVNYLTKYTETMAKLSELEGSEMSTEEALYYAEVSARISAKMLEAM